MLGPGTKRSTTAHPQTSMEKSSTSIWVTRWVKSVVPLSSSILVRPKRKHKKTGKCMSPRKCGRTDFDANAIWVCRSGPPLLCLRCEPGISEDGNKRNWKLKKNGCVEFPSLGHTPYFRMKPNEHRLSTEWLLLSTSSSRLSTTSYSYDILMIVTGAQNPDTPIPLCSHQNHWQTEYPFPPCILGFD